MPCGIPRSKTTLDERDLDAIQSLADGQTMTTISKRMGHHRKTLDIRLQHIRATILPSKNNTNLVAEAIRKGYID